MANTLHGISFDRASTTSSRNSQGPFLNKLKSGLSKFINRRRHSSIVDTFRPSKYQYSPARQNSFSDQDNDDDDDDSEDDLDSISNNRTNNGLQHSIYSKDDDVERIRYNNATCYPHQQKSTTIPILSSPPTILIKKLSTHSSSNNRPTNSLQNSSQYRHTNSLQNSSIVSTSSGKPTHYHHSRQYSHISFMSTSNMTVNSEDLTAKEFADMTGIRIISDSDNDDDVRGGDQSDDMAATSTTMATSTSLAPGGHQQRPSFYSNQINDETHWSVVSSGSYQSQQSVSVTTASASKIWDTEFWKQPCTENHHHLSTMPTEPISTKKKIQHQPSFSGDGVRPVLKNQRSALLQHRQTLSLPSPTTTSIPCQHTKSQSNCDFPIIHELRRIHSSSSNNQQDSNNNDACVIRKGRFEIHLKP